MDDPMLRPQIEDAMGKPGDFSRVLDAVGQKYPALQPHLGNFRVQWGPEQTDGRQLEFYPPWESHNPNPGMTTLELYNREMVGPVLESAIAGDALHLLGTSDPMTGQAVDPKFLGMKQQFQQSLTPGQLEIDRRVFSETGDKGSFEDWMDRSRVDAYIRGYLTPDERDEWRQQGTYTDDQKRLLDQMQQYLTTPRQ